MKKIIIYTYKDPDFLDHNNIDEVIVHPLESFWNWEPKNCVFINKVEILKESVVYVSHKFTNNQVNNDCMSLYFLFSLIKKYAPKLVLLLPYLPYSRKDKSDYSHTYIDSETIFTFLKWCKHFWVDELVSIDVHNDIIKECSPIPLHVISWYSIFEKYITDDAVIVSPDFWSTKRNSVIASHHWWDHIIIDKKRDEKWNPHIQWIYTSNQVALKNKEFFLIDDMIDSWGTLLAVVEYLFSWLWATRINILVTHCILSWTWLKNLRQMITAFPVTFMTTNSYKHNHELWLHLLPVEPWLSHYLSL